MDDLQQVHTGILLSTRLLNESRTDRRCGQKEKGLKMGEKSIVQARDIQLAMELIRWAHVCKCWKVRRN